MHTRLRNCQKVLDRCNGVIVNYITVEVWVPRAAGYGAHNAAENSNLTRQKSETSWRMKMKCLRFAVPIVFMSMATLAFAQADLTGDNLTSFTAFAVPFFGQYESAPSTAQTDAPKPEAAAHMDHAQKAVAPKSEAQISFG